jgi:hypothetical protein
MDSETKVRFKGLYIETEDYKSVPYKLEEKIVKECKDEELKKVHFLNSIVNLIEIER